ncbi:vWA domain-containing protein [Streptomyces muensis]|uniref:VWA domain-containing protein n=1 Tax=Streptomyces muensis TaxID=1077944 RepID=A0A9X1PVH6_STRM4|nr:vWA domain-containing protein [Streptomyces muensis]MCF1594317.1 VWA domain-containing protein [Streptomyces muensis]
MSVPMPGADRHRLHLVPAEGPLTGQRIGVPAATLPAATGQDGLPALLTLNSAVDPVSAAVRLVPLAAVPDGVVAVNEDLAARLGLDEGSEGRDWRLDAVPVEPVKSVTLESSVEAPFDVLAREIGEAGLQGTLLWIPSQEDAELWIDVPGSAAFRVRALEAGGRRGVLVEIGERTDVELFVSSARNGVDIVILADCSGSMSVPDIPEYSEGSAYSGYSTHGGTRGRPRMDVLRSALNDLLEMRLRISGRVSRLAMLKFTHVTEHVFPRDGGMAELDAGSTGPAVEEFRNAVAVLRPEDAGTDIGNALHEAANLLYLHGKPGNERLIVLVSDGAHWSRRGNDGVGEVVYADREPVSLMEYLHVNTKVRLHAVGVSTMAMYRRWIAAGNRGGEVFEPNHELLQQLVRVGGGDAAAIGGFDVLARYFSGLGAGMTRRVSLGRARRHRPDETLPPRLGEALRLLARQHRVNTAAGAAHQETHDARSLGQRLRESTGVAIGESRRALGRALFREEPVLIAVNRAVVTLQTRPHPTFERDLASAFSPARLATVPPELTEPLDTLGTLLEQLRAARQNGAWDTARRIAWVAELATAMDALVVALKTLPDVRHPPGAPANTAPLASAPDAHAQEPPKDPHGATPAPVPPRDGYDSTETGTYVPAPAASTPTAPEPDRQTPTTTPLFRYRGEE